MLSEVTVGKGKEKKTSTLSGLMLHTLINRYLKLSLGGLSAGFDENEFQKRRKSQNLGYTAVQKRSKNEGRKLTSRTRVSTTRWWEKQQKKLKVL